MERKIEKLLNYKGLAEKTGLTVRTIQRMKYQGLLPFVNCGNGKAVRFRESAVAEAIRKLEEFEV
jgi:excisionase family DNA binding protein